MKNILCTFILLFLGPSAFSSPFDLSDYSEGEKTVSLAEEAEEIAAGFEVEFSANLQEDFFKTRVIFNADFSFFFETLLEAKIVIIKPLLIIPNLSTAQIIFPFHSFP